VYQLEISSTGTYHWQMFSQWKKLTTAKTIDAWMQSADHRPVKMDNGAEQYCEKEYSKEADGTPAWSHRIAGPWRRGSKTTSVSLHVMHVL
jgi:hypothetical protein